MKKESVYFWEAEVDGVSHIIRCVPMKSLFEVYVDDELAIKAPRKLKSDNEDSEYDLRIGRKWCKFVVYDGAPDVAVDGILLGVEEEMARKELRSKLLRLFGGAFLVIVCAYATFLWYGYEVTGNPVFGGVFGLIGIQIFMVGGIVMIVTALKKKKEY